MNLPADIPPEALPFLRQTGYLEADRLRPGDPAPDGAVYTPAGDPAAIRRFWSERPAVFVFGSYT